MDKVKVVPDKPLVVRTEEGRNKVSVGGDCAISVKLLDKELVCKRGHIQHVGMGAPPPDLNAENGDTYLDLTTGKVYQLEAT